MDIIHKKSKKKLKSVLLFSGGMDSFICNYLLKPDILLYIKTGSKYEQKELNKLSWYIYDNNLQDKFKVVDLSFLSEYELQNAHIPLRNLFFIEIASFYGDIIYLGALLGETSKDKMTTFRLKTERLLSYCWDDDLGIATKKKIFVKFPLRHRTKYRVLKLYIKRGGNVKELDTYTVSCYNNEFDFCGKCMSCFRRWVAEILNNLNVDKYHTSPYLYYKELMKDYKGFWNKFKIIFKKEFYINSPSNFDAYRACRRYEISMGYRMGILGVIKDFLKSIGRLFNVNLK